ncbi:hypothetical protein DSECCO2_646090 [anaerobic digester metagenome]
MVGDLLHRQGMNVVTSDELQDQNYSSWCITNLNDIMSDDFSKLKNNGIASNSVSIHCGSYPPYYRVSDEALRDIFSLLEASIKNDHI